MVLQEQIKLILDQSGHLQVAAEDILEVMQVELALMAAVEPIQALAELDKQLLPLQVLEHLQITHIMEDFLVEMEIQVQTITTWFKGLAAEQVALVHKALENLVTEETMVDQDMFQILKEQIIAMDQVAAELNTIDTPQMDILTKACLEEHMVDMAEEKTITTLEEITGLLL